MGKDLSMPEKGDLSQYLDAGWLEARPSGNSSLTIQIDLDQGKAGKWVCPLAPSVPSSGGMATASLCEPIKNCFFVCYSLVGFMDASPFRGDCFGDLSLRS